MLAFTPAAGRVATAVTLCEGGATIGGFCGSPTAVHALRQLCPAVQRSGSYREPHQGTGHAAPLEQKRPFNTGRMAHLYLGHGALWWRKACPQPNRYAASSPGFTGRHMTFQLLMNTFGDAIDGKDGERLFPFEILPRRHAPACEARHADQPPP